MKSMTGYAKRRIALGDSNLTIEIKTLNSKQLDLNVKLPSSLRDVELPVRGALQRLERGKVDVLMQVEEGNERRQALDTNTVRQRVADIMGCARQCGIDYSREEALHIILAQNDIWQTSHTAELSDKEAEQIMDAVAQAIDDVDRFRQEEGDVLRLDFDKHVAAIEQSLKRIPEYESERIETARERIEHLFEEFATVEVNRERLEQEMIYYLEKLDITEEKVRLQKHIDYFRTTMDNEPICGKKLSFIAQEMGREINTTGSKANHIEIQRLVVEMKDELEKIKEQLGNIL